MGRMPPVQVLLLLPLLALGCRLSQPMPKTDVYVLEVERAEAPQSGVGGVVRVFPCVACARCCVKPQRSRAVCWGSRRQAASRCQGVRTDKGLRGDRGSEVTGHFSTLNRIAQVPGLPTS